MKHRYPSLSGFGFFLWAVVVILLFILAKSVAHAQTNIPIAVRPSQIWNDGYTIVVLWKADDVPTDYSIQSSYDLVTWRVENTAVSWPRGQFAVFIEKYDPLIASKFYILTPAVVSPTESSSVPPPVTKKKVPAKKKTRK